MIKVKSYIIFLSLLLILSGCTNNPSLNTKTIANQQDSNNSDMKTISFDYFFRGFVTLKENQGKSYPYGSYILENAENWGDFMDKYLRGIPYYASPDFSKESLVFSVLFPAKPNYSVSHDIKTFIVSENMLQPEYLNVSGIPNGIYVQNSNGIEHAFVNIVKILKRDVPKDAKNIYHKGDIISNYEEWHSISKLRYIQGTIVSLKQSSEGKFILNLKVEVNYHSETDSIGSLDFPFKIGEVVEFTLKYKPEISLSNNKRIIIYEGQITTDGKNDFLGADIKYYEEEGKYFNMTGKEINLPPQDYPISL